MTETKTNNILREELYLLEKEYYILLNILWKRAFKKEKISEDEDKKDKNRIKYLAKLIEEKKDILWINL